MNCQVQYNAGLAGLDRLVREILPPGPVRRIAIKPNWVMHETDPAFPIRALVTSPAVIDVVIGACLDRYPNLETITVGDVPLQTCLWDVMVRQSGLDRVIKRYKSTIRGVDVSFRDLRRQRFRVENGFQVQTGAPPGDPLGYRDVVLDGESYLDEISSEANNFRVSDYDPRTTMNSHSPGCHRYLIAASLLDCDLFINLPKMKTHQKAGITGALKNLVGMNGEKAYLVHYRSGTPAQGGDEFPPDIHPLIRLQSGVRARLQKRSRPLFLAARAGWAVTKTVFGIQTSGSVPQGGKIFYRAGGAWPGNDTIWRMIYDLNQIVRYAPSSGGVLSATPQRQYLAVIDGLGGGEGNGPLQPCPAPIDACIASTDPFLADMSMARLMGLDRRKIPQLGHSPRFRDAEWGRFDPSTVPVVCNGEIVAGIDRLPVLHPFRPAPGWDIELPNQTETLCKSFDATPTSVSNA